MRARIAAVCCAALASLGPGQTLRVVSEFQRIDPFDAVVPADRAARPREILSPALARNAWASFRVVVTLPRGGAYTLYVGQNPENAVRVRVFREQAEQAAGRWVPDRLIEISLPYTGKLPDPAAGIAGQTAATFWLDVWVAADAPVRRIKIEPQLWVSGEWVVYPMEARVVAAIVPAAASIPPVKDLPPVGASSESAALPALRGYLCQGVETGSPGSATARQLVLRNAAQDMRLARALERGHDRRQFLAAMLSAAPLADPETWCASPPPQIRPPGGTGPEWYLRVRDFLYRGGLGDPSLR